MKVQSAVVKLVLRENKLLKNGTHPIMLRVSFNGMKELSTHCSCKKSEWNSSTMTVKKSVANCDVINTTIQGLLARAISIRNDLEARQKPYTPSLILEYMTSEKVSPRAGYEAILDEYIVEKNIRLTTIKAYKASLSLLKKYLGDSFKIDDVNTKLVTKIVKEQVTKGISEGYMRSVLNRWKSLHNYAIEKGYTKEPWKFKIRQLKTASKMVYVHKDTIEVLKKYLMSKLIVIGRNGGWSFNDEGVEEVLNGKSKLFSLYFFLLIYLFQGLSPIDMARIEFKNLKSVKVKDNDYWAYDCLRQKTSIGVKVRIRRHNPYNDMMINVMLYFRQGKKYFLPILDGVNAFDENAVRLALNNVSATLNKKLKVVFDEVNSEIVAANVENKDNVPLIPSNATFYTARHSYAMTYLKSPRSTPSAMATLLGRSINTLSQYISQLEEESDLTSAADAVDY